MRIGAQVNVLGHGGCSKADARMLSLLGRRLAVDLDPITEFVSIGKGDCGALGGDSERS